MKVSNINYIENKLIPGIKKNAPKHNSFNMFMAMAIIGGRNSGKTNCLLNLIQDLQKQKCIDDIYIISPTEKANPFHVLKVDEENKYNPHLEDLEEVLGEIIDKNDTKLDIWHHIRDTMTKREFNKMYKELFKYFEEGKYQNITDDGINLLKYCNYNKKQNFYEDIPSCCVILDDCVGKIKYKKDSNLGHIVLNGRHRNINVFILAQCFHKGIPNELRDNMEQYIIFALNNNEVIKSIFNEVCSAYFENMDKFKQLYDEATKKDEDGTRHFLLVDHNPRADHLRFRKDFNKIINY